MQSGLPADDVLRELECPVCFEFYSTDNNNPKILVSCGHTGCEGCLKAIASASHGVITCPLCNVPTKVPRKGLPTNFSLLGVALKLVKKDESPQKTHQPMTISNSLDVSTLEHLPSRPLNRPSEAIPYRTGFARSPRSMMSNRCYNCLEEGHFAMRCPDPPRNQPLAPRQRGQESLGKGARTWCLPKDVTDPEMEVQRPNVLLRPKDYVGGFQRHLEARGGFTAHKSGRLG